MFHLNTLFILALVLFGGTLGGRLFQKMKIPQVVGYIIMGVILGQSGLRVIDLEMIDSLQPIGLSMIDSPSRWFGPGCIHIQPLQPYFL